MRNILFILKINDLCSIRFHHMSSKNGFPLEWKIKTEKKKRENKTNFLFFSFLISLLVTTFN